MIQGLAVSRSVVLCALAIVGIGTGRADRWYDVSRQKIKKSYTTDFCMSTCYQHVKQMTLSACQHAINMSNDPLCMSTCYRHAKQTTLPACQHAINMSNDPFLHIRVVMARVRPGRPPPPGRGPGGRGKH
eukprot:562761-Prorocentrum_minimum.AAC.1